MDGPAKSEGKVNRDQMPLSAKAKDGKTVATALLPPPVAFPAGILGRTLEAAVAACEAYIEGRLFPEEIQRYEQIPGESKRRSYPPLHIYLSFSRTAGADGAAGLSSCLGQLLFYRGEQLAQYRIFTLTADESAQILLPNSALIDLLSGKSRKPAKKSVPLEHLCLQGDRLVACRPMTENLPLRCRRRDVRERLLEQRELGKIREYRSPFPKMPPADKKSAKKSKKRRKNPLDKPGNM